jgi:hypothetical protein
MTISGIMRAMGDKRLARPQVAGRQRYCCLGFWMGAKFMAIRGCQE